MFWDVRCKRGVRPYSYQLYHKCSDQCSLEASVEKNENESLDFTQVGKKKPSPNKQRAVLIWQVRVIESMQLGLPLETKYLLYGSLSASGKRDSLFKSSRIRT